MGKMQINMTLSKRDIRSLKQAIVFAIDYEESFIDAHRTAFARGKNAYLKPKIVLKENRPAIAKAQRNIRIWLKLRAKLNDYNKLLSKTGGKVERRALIPR